MIDDTDSRIDLEDAVDRARAAVKAACEPLAADLDDARRDRARLACDRACNALAAAERALDNARRQVIGH